MCAVHLPTTARPIADNKVCKTLFFGCCFTNDSITIRSKDSDLYQFRIQTTDIIGFDEHSVAMIGPDKYDTCEIVLNDASKYTVRIVLHKIEDNFIYVWKRGPILSVTSSPYLLRGE